MNKKLKFTFENWNRHINYNNHYLTTGRNEKKCEVGDVLIFPDGNEWECIVVDDGWEMSAYSQEFWVVEGFRSSEELFAELERIYGYCMIYPHIFKIRSLKK